LSILNVHIAADESLVGVDTEARNDGGDVILTSKLFAIPHLFAVIAFRGNMWTCQRSFWELLPPRRERRIGSFDELLPHMPEILKASWIDAAEMEPEDLGDEAVLSGWSSAQGRVVAMLYDRKVGALDFAASSLSRHHVAPWHEELALAPEPACKRSMLELAQAQCELIYAKAPRRAAGGDFICAQVRRDCIRIEKLGTLVRRQRLGAVLGMAQKLEI
jgi:hypothetical protein